VPLVINPAYAALTGWLLAVVSRQAAAYSSNPAVLVWFTKIAGDPFNDIRQYLRAPLALLPGERFAIAYRAPVTTA